MRLLYRNNYIGIIYSVNSGIEINANSSNLQSKRLVVFIPEVRKWRSLHDSYFCITYQGFSLGCVSNADH